VGLSRREGSELTSLGCWDAEGFREAEEVTEEAAAEDSQRAPHRQAGGKEVRLRLASSGVCGRVASSWVAQQRLVRPLYDVSARRDLILGKPRTIRRRLDAAELVEAERAGPSTVTASSMRSGGHRGPFLSGPLETLKRSRPTSPSANRKPSGASRATTAAGIG